MNAAAKELTVTPSSNRILQKILDTTRESVLVVDADMRIVGSNSPAVETFGRGSDLEGKRLSEAVRDLDLHEAFRRAIFSNASSEVRLELNNADRRFDVHVAPLELDGDTQAIGFFYETTKIERLESIRQEFLSNISHELRTPLTSILGATEMLSDSQGGYTPKELTEFLQMLQNSSKRLNMMVDDFLTATKIESGEIIREMENKEYRITPMHITQRLIDELEYQSKHHQVTIRNNVPDVTISVHMYAPHVENILKRLLDNAIKFSKPEGTVIVDLQEKDGYLFTIQDFGIGISETKRSVIFQKFGQVDREKNEQQGSGLGLYIAYHLAKLNGADVWYESAEHKGSTFFLKIPKQS